MSEYSHFINAIIQLYSHNNFYLLSQILNSIWQNWKKSLNALESEKWPSAAWPAGCFSSSAQQWNDSNEMKIKT